MADDHDNNDYYHYNPIVFVATSYPSPVPLPSVEHHGKRCSVEDTRISMTLRPLSARLTRLPFADETAAQGGLHGP